MRTKKYNYFNVIQQNYGHGWEDNSQYPANSDGTSIDKDTRDLLRHDLAEYTFTGYPTRTILRRELIQLATA